MAYVNSPSCPTCRKPAWARDVRLLHGTTQVIGIGTREMNDLIQQLEMSNYLKQQAEERAAKALLDAQVAGLDADALRHQNVQLQQQLTKKKVKRTHDQAFSQSGCRPLLRSRQEHMAHHSVQATIDPSAVPRGSRPVTNDAHPNVNGRFVRIKTQRIQTNDGRVMAFDSHHQSLVLSKSSGNRLFPGHGVMKVSLESTSVEYFNIHDKPIRDIKFSPFEDGIILTASMDKTLRLSSTRSNSVVHKFQCVVPVWSVAWSQTDENIVYAGLQNGTLVGYDIRTSGRVLQHRPTSSMPCPITSLDHITGSPHTNFSGLQVGTVQGAWLSPDGNHTNDIRLNAPEGATIHLSYDKSSHSSLISLRPNRRTPKVSHTVLQLSGTDSYLYNVVRAPFYGGSAATQLSRSALFPCGGTTLCAAGDEKRSVVQIWNTTNGEHLTDVSTVGAPTDVCPFTCNTSSPRHLHHLATLTKSEMRLFKFQPAA